MLILNVKDRTTGIKPTAKNRFFTASTTISAPEPKPAKGRHGRKSTQKKRPGNTPWKKTKVYSVAMNMYVVISESEQDTVKLGGKIAKKLKKGDIIALSGDLGTGKTAFVKGLASGLGIREYVTSPTFTLVQSYKGQNVTLHHFDVYRISDEDELFEIGFDEYLYEGNICVIEWADLIKNLIPPRSIWINFERMPDGLDKRKITIKGLETE